MREALLATLVPLGVFAVFSIVILVAIAWSHEAEWRRKDKPPSE